VTFRRLICVAAATTAVTGTSAGIAASGAAAAETLTGAGSTLVAPLEADWAQGFQNSTGSVATYDAVGSATGVDDASSGGVDFGAADVPLSAYSGVCAGCVEIPWALSATGIGYNIPRISNSTNTQVRDALKLTGAVLAKIYLGQITTWNNPAIVKLNRGLTLPSLEITPVWRTDASGETYAFTNFLSDVSSAWSSSKGYATTVPFPAGIGENGDAGVAAEVARTPGAIGYVSADGLLVRHLATAAVQNTAGNYELPELDNIGAAATSTASLSSNGGSIVDPPQSQETAYPISAFTYAVIPATVTDPGLLEKFLTYAVTSGRDFGVGLDFEPLPAAVQSYDEGLINKL
jgi:phosphate transport system substrate-binding protein